MHDEIDFEQINLKDNPPINEPDRQYYFIAKCRQYVTEFEHLNGRLPKACVVTFGCPFV